MALLRIAGATITLAGAGVLILGVYATMLDREETTRRRLVLGGTGLLIFGALIFRTGEYYNPFALFAVSTAVFAVPVFILLWLALEGYYAKVGSARSDAPTQRQLDYWSVEEDEGATSESRESETQSIPVYPLFAPVIGVGVLLAVAGFVQPVVAITVGAVVTVGLLMPASGQRWFAGVGSVFVLGSGVALAVTGAGSPAYQQSALVALGGFGVLGCVLAGLRWIGKHVVKRFGRRYGSAEDAEVIWQFVSALLGLVTIIWTVLTAHEKITRYGGVAGVGTVTFVLGLFGIEIPIPVWFLSDGVDATVVGFVGATLAAFWVLETVRTVGAFVQVILAAYKWLLFAPVRVARQLAQ